MKTITLKYMDGLSIPCNIGNKYTTVIDIIKELHLDNEYIYSIYNIGNENRLSLDTNLRAMVLIEDNKDLFILKENIPPDFLNVTTIWDFYTTNPITKLRTKITTYTEFIHTTNIFILNEFCGNSKVNESDLLLLQHCKNLDILEIRCDKFDKNKINVASFEHLTSLRTLSLSYCCNVDSVFYLSNLRSLSIVDSGQIFGPFTCYEKLTQLEELSLDIDNEFGLGFEVIHTLRKLHFKTKGVYDSNYTPLEDLTNLEELTLEYNVYKSESYAINTQDKIEISLFNNFRNLRILSIINFRILIPDDRVFSIINGVILTAYELDILPALEELSLTECKISNLSFMKKLINLKSLVLNLIFNKEDKLDLSPIQYLYNLETIKLRRISGDISTALCKLPKLKKLYIYDAFDFLEYSEEKIKKIKPNMSMDELQKYLDDV